jgi:hypothetical protein
MDEELQGWMDMWDAAQGEEEFQSPPAAVVPDPIDDDDHAVYARMMGMETGEEETLLQEEKTPNPVYPDSAGPDNQAPKSVWVNEDLLKELEGLKNKLFKLENKMAELGVSKKEVQKPVEMKFGETMSSQMEQIKKKIDKISNSLGIKDEPSPWEIKEGK